MTEAIETKLFIDGAYCAAGDKGTYEIFNPARPSELVGRAAAGTPIDVERAMQAAQAAHAAFPSWSALSYRERANKLRKVAAAITQDMEEVEARAQLFTREHGKILFETRLEINRLGERFVQCANLNTELVEATIECGTQPLDTVLDALRLEQALHVHGHPGHARFAEIKQRLRDGFYVDTPKWKAQVFEQTVGYCEGALRCLVQESFSSD